MLLLTLILSPYGVLDQASNFLEKVHCLRFANIILFRTMIQLCIGNYKFFVGALFLQNQNNCFVRFLELLNVCELVCSFGKHQIFSLTNSKRFLLVGCHDAVVSFANALHNLTLIQTCSQILRLGLFLIKTNFFVSEMLRNYAIIHRFQLLNQKLVCSVGV